ncbi:MAG TPA: glycosyltransferase family 39 protein, partial [Usitatibacter sp.]|nr:glycosyltransferase family 39 protein [Usitatibacter sp.]
MARTERTAAAGLAVALVIGAALTIPGLGPAASWDGTHAYLPLARRLLAEGPAFFSAPDAVMYAPLAYVWPALFGGIEIAVRSANVALFLGTIALAWHAATVAHSRPAGIAAALLVAISPELRLYAADALTEPLFIFLVAAWTAAVAHLARDGEPHPRAWLALGAVALAAAPLSRPALTLFAPIAAVACTAWALLAPQARRALAWRLAALHGLAVLGPLAWIVHNQLVHGVPSVANGLGGALWLGIDPMVDGFDPLYFGLDFDTGGIARDIPHLSSAGDRILRGGALLQLHDLPLAVIAQMMLRKLAAFLTVTSMEPSIFVAPHRAWRLAVLVLGASGLAWQRRSVFAWALAAYAAYMTAAHLPLLYNHRYSIGALDLPLALLAGIAIAELARERRRALVAGCLTTAVVAAGIAMLARAAPGSPHVEMAPGQVLVSRDIAAIEDLAS